MPRSKREEIADADDTHTALSGLRSEVGFIQLMLAIRVYAPSQGCTITKRYHSIVNQPDTISNFPNVDQIEGNRRETSCVSC